MKKALSFLPVILHPLFSAMFCLCLGIWWQNSTLPESLIPSLFLTFFLGTALWFKNKTTFLLTGVFFLLGASVFWYQQSRLTVTFPLCNLSFNAIVKNKSFTGNPYWPYRIKIDIPKIENPETQAHHSFSFFVYTKCNPHCSYDDLIECHDITIKQPRPGELKNYLCKQGAIGTVFTPAFNPTVLKPAQLSFFGWLEAKRETIFKSLKQKMSYSTFAFFSSLFMGDKSRVKKTIEKQKGPFRVWGISHHLARSGLHLMLFILVWHLLMSLLPLSFNWKIAFISFLSCVYFLLTPSTISFIRAFELFILYKTCNLFDKQINSLYLICLVCCITLLHNPFQLFFLDFQLSFYLTFCLAWLAQLDRQKKLLI